MTEITSKIKQVFRKFRVMTLDELCKLLEGRSRRSVFRDLSSANYYSSYTHAGKYYTLDSIPQFNSDGLWHYREIGFSKYGTLKNTIVEFVNRSTAGEPHESLATLLRVRVHNVLLLLVRSQKIQREQIDNIYVYISSDPSIATKQLKYRSEKRILSSTVIELPSELIQIEIFAEIIRASQLRINAKSLYQRLTERKLKVTMAEVEKVLSYYDIKKNRI